MEGAIIFLQDSGDYACTSKSFDFAGSMDLDDVAEILGDIELEILESPRKMKYHEDSNDRIITYPISAIVKRGMKSVVKPDFFNSRAIYNEFLDALNSRRNDYVMLNM